MKMSNEDFMKMCKGLNPSAGANHQENLQQIKNKLNKKENDVVMFKNKKVKKSAMVAAAAIATLSLSAAVFGADIVNYFRSVNLGEHATFVSGGHTLGEHEEFASVGDAYRNDETLSDYEIQALIDGGYLIVSKYGNHTTNFLTFEDASEGVAHFIADVKLPTWLPVGFELENVFFFVETLEELQQPGANKYLGLTFSNGRQEFRAQIRYMTEESAFVSGGGPDIQTMQINGNDAVVEDGVVNILIGDVMYMFFGMGIVETNELINIAASLQ